MNRLEKKCCIAAAGFHLLLLAILLVGPAFLSSPQKIDDSQAITMIDLSKLTDGPTMTGGSPASAPPQTSPQPPTPPAPPAVVEPPAPPQKTVLEKIFEPEPAKPAKEEEPAIEPAPQKVIIKVKAPDTEAAPKVSSKPKVEVARKIVKRSPTTGKSSSTAKDDAEAKADPAAARRERAAAISRVLGSLESNLSSGTEVSIPGPGAGTFVNYAEAVKRVYTEAWIAPTDVTDDEATAQVSVTIARDGNVISARMKTPSGSAPVDRSVQETLRRVKFVAPFPEGAKDGERTFIINFNLKAKRQLG